MYDGKEKHQLRCYFLFLRGITSRINTKKIDDERKDIAVIAPSFFVNAPIPSSKQHTEKIRAMIASLFMSVSLD